MLNFSASDKTLAIFLVLVSMLLGVSGLGLWLNPAQAHLMGLGAAISSENLARLPWLGVEAMFGGSLVAVLTWVMWRRPLVWNQIGAWLRNEQAILIIVSIFLVSVWGGSVLLSHQAQLDGQTYWWLGDDAMISMRYAYQLAAGRGLQWNPLGPPVEGYTNFLWTMYMALIHQLPLSSAITSLPVLLTNLLLAVLTLPALARLVRLVGGSALTVTATLIAYALSRPILTWAASGFETSLLTYLWLIALNRVLTEAQQHTPRAFTFGLIALITLVRADAVSLAVGLYILAGILHAQRRQVFLYVALSGLLPLAHLLFRWSYYGAWLPNTAYLKTMGWDSRYWSGLIYLVEFMAHHPFWVLGVIITVVRATPLPLRYLAAFIVGYSLYVAYIGGDAFHDFRFFVPLLPLGWVLTFMSIQTLPFEAWAKRLQEVKVSGWMRVLLFVGGALTLALGLLVELIGAGATAGFGLRQVLRAVSFGMCLSSVVWPFGTLEISRAHLTPRRLKQFAGVLCLITAPMIFPGYSFTVFPSEAEVGNVAIGLLLKHNTPTDRWVADSWAGSVMYFSERPAIDLLGKSDSYIAHLPVASTGTKPGHNKFDYDYSLNTLRPDFVVANFKLPVSLSQMQQLSTGDAAFTGQLYFNATFQMHCLPYPVSVDTWRTLFVCDWSPELENRDHWVPLSNSH